MSEPTAEIDVKQALTDLIASDGWKLFLSAVEHQWGARACMALIDNALKELARGDREAEQETVAQIRSAARAVLAMSEWPHAQLAAMKAGAEEKRTGFNRWRRA